MNLNVKNQYSFSTRAPGILGASYKNLKLVSIMTYDLANSLINVQAYHANVYPALPQGTQDNPESYTYFLFKTEQNTNVVMADVWIDEQTLSEQGSQTLIIEIPNITNTEIFRVSNILNTMGIAFNSKVV